MGCSSRVAVGYVDAKGRTKRLNHRPVRIPSSASRRRWVFAIALPWAETKNCIFSCRNLPIRITLNSHALSIPAPQDFVGFASPFLRGIVLLWRRRRGCVLMYERPRIMYKRCSLHIPRWSSALDSSPCAVRQIISLAQAGIPVH